MSPSDLSCQKAAVKWQNVASLGPLQAGFGSTTIFGSMVRTTMAKWEQKVRQTARSMRRGGKPPGNLRMKYLVVVTTTESAADARKIADVMIERRLASCVQIVGPIRSVYPWEGKRCDSEEFRIEMKTREDKFSEIQQLLPTLHPYDLPELIALPLYGISPEYQCWLDEQLLR